MLHAEDEEMKQMAQEETEKIRSQMQTLEAQLEILLLPKDPLDERSIMLEVLSATALFASEFQTAVTVIVSTLRTLKACIAHATACDALWPHPINISILMASVQQALL